MSIGHAEDIELIDITVLDVVGGHALDAVESMVYILRTVSLKAF